MPSFIARQHNEWLSLLEISGPFLSMPVLERVFPDGLDAVEGDLRHRLRSAYEQWVREQDVGGIDVAVHTAWMRFVLEKVLGMQRQAGNNSHTLSLLREGTTIPAHLSKRFDEHGGITLAPDYALCDPSDQGRLLVTSYFAEQRLDGPLPHQQWPASPKDGMVDLLRYTGVTLGLVTNGEQWMLIYAPPHETTSFISWYAHLWLEEPLTLRALRSLLHQHRFFSVAEQETLERLLAESVDFQQEVTDQLGYQVRRAMAVLIRSLNHIDRDRQRFLLRDMEPEKLYEAALTVMMRLVFLLFAEERQLLPLGERLYDENYAASTLLSQLQEVSSKQTEAFLEQKCDAWSRLLSLFRVVHDGISHQDLSLRAYDGRLFDPDRFPFLEGRLPGTSWREVEAQPLPINNRTVLHLLHALQYLQVKGSGGVEARRLSFRSLDIEQIGHVYEGLLDHTARRASSPVLGLTVKGMGRKYVEEHKEEGVEIPLSRLEDCLQTKGEDGLFALLSDVTGHTRERLKRDFATLPDAHRLDRLRAACENDETLFQRVKPFAGLLRTNSFEEPVVILPGSFYMTSGTDRRTTGTHYTPRTLTRPMVEYTLEPLVFSGPAEGLDKPDWRLHTPVELLNLKVCDMAMGSGAFLVESCRYLARRLVEAWEQVEMRYPRPVTITPEGTEATGKLGEIIVPIDPTEREALARRLIAERCLYGVDKNSLAVEMAKLSLWLITLSKDRPFTFLDHALRAGDSLLGVNLEQLQTFSMEAGSKDVEGFTLEWIAAEIEPALLYALEKRAELRAIPDDDLALIERKKKLLAEAEQAMAIVRLGADILILTTLASYSKQSVVKNAEYFRNSYENLLREYRATRNLPPQDIAVLRVQNALRDMRKTITDLLEKRTPFHWFLELPEAFLTVEDGHISNGKAHGFDALVSNPPFQGGSRITGPLGTDYRLYLIDNIAFGKRGNADISAYFFLRATGLVRANGQCALLATNTIAQGDTRKVGLDQITSQGWTIPRALASVKWPGTANLEVAQVWLRFGIWKGQYLLEDKPVTGISTYLTSSEVASSKPYTLLANAEKSYLGSYVLGAGFILQPEDAQNLIGKDSRNKEILFPYLGGKDLYSSSDYSAIRWVINFFDWPLTIAETYADCIQIIREKVKPERDLITYSKNAKEKWWQYERSRPELYGKIEGMKRILVKAQVSETWGWLFVPNGMVYDQKLIVFVFAEYNDFALLQSTIHWAWASLQGLTLRLDMTYTPSSCFETFPFPLDTAALESIGQRYYQHRQSIMQARQEGLTATYNRFHNPRESAADIQQLRELHREMDEAVAAAYGWQDLELGHSFHETKQGTRYTISEEARREVLGRLLKLNHERYAQEVAAGLHEKGTKAGKVLGKRGGGKGQRKVTNIAAARENRNHGPQEGNGGQRKVAESRAEYRISGEIVQQPTLFNDETITQRSLFDETVE